MQKISAVKNLKNANELETKLRTLLGHDRVIVNPYGEHLMIQLLIDSKPETIARFSEVQLNLYTAGFRTNKGRWEPLPGEGSLLDMAELVVDLLGPYFDIDNF